MNSFYGGKQGRTYNIVERYDQIYIDQTQLEAFNPNKIYHPGDIFTYQSENYKVLGQINDQGQIIEDITLSQADLQNEDKVAKIKGMVNQFQKGGAYTDANYGQYVIIDTILNENHKNDDINGLIYRRGFDYTQPVSSYNRPRKDDQQIRTIIDKINGVQYEYTGKLSTYHDYKLKLNNNIVIPDDKGFNSDKWTAAWRKYVLKPGGGAIYVGHIVGPQGDTPQLKGLTWAEYLKHYEDIGDTVTKGIVDITKVLGWEDDDKKYNDNIQLGYCNIIDKDQQLVGCYISFNIPTKVIKISGQSVDPYGNDTREHSDSASGVKDTDLKIKATKVYDTSGKFKGWKYDNLIHQHSKTGINAGHPFYENYDIAIPKGIHGRDIETIQQITAQNINSEIPNKIIINQRDIHSNNYISSEDKYIVYRTRDYNETAAGALSVPLGCWPYRVIEQITINYKERRYFSDWGGQVKIGSLYPLLADRFIYGICVKEGTTLEDEIISVDRQLTDQQILGTQIGSGDSLWRAVRIPQTAAARSLEVNYTAGKNDTLAGFRALDYLSLDDNGNLYAVYSDLDQLYFLGTIGSISDLFFDQTDSHLKVFFNDGRQYSFVINQILQLARKGDTIAVLYSDARKRDEIESSGVQDKDWYYLPYKGSQTDYRGKKYVWQNFGSLGAQYHVQGEYTITDLKTGILKDGFIGSLADRAGWIVSVKDGNFNSLYAYDYNLQNNHTWPDGTPTRWYKLKELDSGSMLPQLAVRVSSENASGLIWQEDYLNANGLWFVVSGGHDL